MGSIRDTKVNRCPAIPAGYGTAPGDCACGNCPEAWGFTSRPVPKPLPNKTAWGFTIRKTR